MERRRATPATTPKSPPPRDARSRVVAIVEELPGGQAVAHGAHASLEVSRKRFGWFLRDHHGDGRVAVHAKASAASRAALERAMPHQVHVPKYVGQRGWIGLWLDVPGVDWEAVRVALEEAYRMTAPKRLVHALERRASR